MLWQALATSQRCQAIYVLCKRRDAVCVAAPQAHERSLCCVSKCVAPCDLCLQVGPNSRCQGCSGAHQSSSGGDCESRGAEEGHKTTQQVSTESAVIRLKPAKCYERMVGVANTVVR